MAYRPKEVNTNFSGILQFSAKPSDRRPGVSSGHTKTRDNRILGYVSSYSILPSSKQLPILYSKDTEILSNCKSQGHILNSHKIINAQSPRYLGFTDTASSKLEYAEKPKLVLPDKDRITEKLSNRRSAEPIVSEALHAISEKSTPRNSKGGILPRFTSSTTNLLHNQAKSIEPYRLKRLNIINEIRKIKSDRIELVRDLATYDANFSSHNELPAKLDNIKKLTKSLPDIYSNLVLFAQSETEILDRMSSGLAQIHKLETETSKHIPEKYGEYCEKYQVKSLSDVHKLKLIFKGVRKVSGKRCIVSISSDSTMSKIEVSLITPDRRCFKRYRIPSDSSLYETIHQNHLSNYEIASIIISHLYLIYYDNQLNLNYDDHCSISFFALCLKLKGFNSEISVLLKQEDDSALIILTEPYIEKRVAYTEFVDNSTEDSFSLDRVSKHLSTHLRYSQELGIHSLDWLSDESNSFKEKEKISKLLDEDYIRTQITEEEFQVFGTFKKELNNKTMSIKLLKCKENLKIRLKYQDKVYELSQDSPDFKFMTSLQGAFLRDSPLTYINSLEFDKTIRKLFK
jgi:hypothetical protein